MEPHGYVLLNVNCRFHLSVCQRYWSPEDIIRDGKISAILPEHIAIKTRSIRTYTTGHFLEQALQQVIAACVPCVIELHHLETSANFRDVLRQNDCSCNPLSLRVSTTVTVPIDAINENL